MWTEQEWLDAIQHLYRVLDPLTVVEDLTAERGAVAGALAQLGTVCDQLEKELAATPPPALDHMTLTAALAEVRVAHRDAIEAANAGVHDRAPHFLARVRKYSAAARSLLVADLQSRVIPWAKRRAESAAAQQVQAGHEKPPRSMREWTDDGERMTAAVVFTDIVDSTGSAWRLGNTTWNGLTAQHYAHATRLAAKHGGCVVKNTGDGQLLVFRAAANALSFLLAVVRDPGTENIRMKGGIHVGTILVRDGDVAGTTANLASRVASCAQEGEVWISDRVHTDVAEEGDPGHSELTFVEHPDRQLKGIDAPQRLWSLAVTERAIERGAGTTISFWASVVEVGHGIESEVLRELLTLRAREASAGEIGAAVICAAGLYDALRIHWTRNYRQARGSDAVRAEKYLPARLSRAAAMCFPKSPSLWQEPVLSEDRHGPGAMASMGFSLDDMQAVKEMSDLVERMASAKPDETIEVDEETAVRALLGVARGIRRLEAESPGVIAAFSAACVAGQAEATAQTE